ncbi:MAG: hypothetical protein MZW92_41430 [Comamonadaceae bacterium]|nr:hypothetical protein [Comamonadaceae bacterium]
MSDWRITPAAAGTITAGTVAAITPAATAKLDSCTVIGAGRLATVDGSVITSHSDCLQRVPHPGHPRPRLPKGAMADVHWGMVYFGAEDDRHALPLGDFGKVIGRIPQVERTYHLLPHRILADERAPAGHRREHLLPARRARTSPTSRA